MPFSNRSADVQVDVKTKNHLYQSNETRSTNQQYTELNVGLHVAYYLAMCTELNKVACSEVEIKRGECTVWCEFLVQVDYARVNVHVEWQIKPNLLLLIVHCHNN